MIDRHRLLTDLRRLFQERGWTESGDVSRLLIEAAIDHERRTGVRPGPGDLVPHLPDAFVTTNGLNSWRIADEVARLVASAAVDSQLPDLITIEQIDSFSRAKTVKPADVAGIANPLDLSERDVKVFIGHIIGEPYLPRDWGGERYDLFTCHLDLAGHPAEAAFLLKGSGTRGRLTIRRLGANADQIMRLATSSASILIVQHVAEVDEEVRRHLRQAIVAGRHDGRDVVGSVWDGVDCARLFVAHDLVAPDSGRPTELGNLLLETDRAALAHSRGRGHV